MVLFLYVFSSGAIDFAEFAGLITKQFRPWVYVTFTIAEVLLLLLFLNFIGTKLPLVLIFFITAGFIVAEWIHYDQYQFSKKDYLIVAAEYLILLICCLLYFIKRSTLPIASVKGDIWQSSRLWSVLALFMYLSIGFLFFTFFQNIDGEKLNSTGLINLPAFAVILRNLIFGVSFLRKQP
jgi:hypothetical protein